jgi:hypothetical protein
MTEDAMYTAPGELFVPPREYAEDIPIESGSDNAKRAPKVHKHRNNRTDIPIIVGI